MRRLLTYALNRCPALLLAPAVAHQHQHQQRPDDQPEPGAAAKPVVSVSHLRFAQFISKIIDLVLDRSQLPQNRKQESANNGTDEHKDYIGGRHRNLLCLDSLGEGEPIAKFLMPQQEMGAVW